jgi:hypothetical protein
MVKTTPAPGDDEGCAWFHLSKPRQPRPPHAGNSSVRWVIVGAGLTGLAVVRQLALNFPNDAVFLVESLGEPTSVGRE